MGARPGRPGGAPNTQERLAGLRTGALTSIIRRAVPCRDMGKVLGQVALALVPLSAAAIAAAFGAWWVVGPMLVLAVVAGATQLRSVQQKVPFLRTDAMRLSRIYQAGYELRSELRRQARYSELERWEEWGSRVGEWDATIWTELRRRRDDWLPLQRTVHSLIYKAHASWVDTTLQSIDERLALLHRLMEE